MIELISTMADDAELFGPPPLLLNPHNRTKRNRSSPSHCLFWQFFSISHSTTTKRVRSFAGWTSINVCVGFVAARPVLRSSKSSSWLTQCLAGLLTFRSLSQHPNHFSLGLMAQRKLAEEMLSRHKVIKASSFHHLHCIPAHETFMNKFPPALPEQIFHNLILELSKFGWGNFTFILPCLSSNFYSFDAFTSSRTRHQIFFFFSPLRLFIFFEGMRKTFNRTFSQPFP